MVKASYVFGVLAIAALTGCASTSRPLFNGQDFKDFDLVTTPVAAPESVYSMQPNGVIAVAGKPSGYFATRESYADYKLHVEWRWSGKPGNSGFLLHVASGPKDGVWPLSQQVQTKHGFVGDLLPMAGASFVEPLTTAPGAYPKIKAKMAADSEKPAGEWNVVDVLARDGVIEVTVNGVLQNRVTGANPREGKIGFQLEGAPYELRNVTITPIP
ncbi:3-keto-disaccharide hydrolase [Massilia horti]|uniref:DUF1080 domain-containing protein n=1 Tax=Massilia horti TaxID=2562153 RepID=A0A4Y9T543_9BURK|nr:DUF1080 domain-containing protein [Massilia horti]TFW34932.1 DUF1080 domain-containing protein [Massilia horti]